MTKEQAIKAVDVALHGLAEHFPVVQVLVSWEEEAVGETHDLIAGHGNWYARQGLAHEFLNRDRARTDAHELGRHLQPPE